MAATEESLKNYRDLRNSLDTAEEKGRLDEKKDTVKRLLATGTSVDIIAIAAGMTENEVKQIIDESSFSSKKYVYNDHPGRLY